MIGSSRQHWWTPSWLSHRNDSSFWCAVFSQGCTVMAFKRHSRCPVHATLVPSQAQSCDHLNGIRSLHGITQATTGSGDQVIRRNGSLPDSGPAPQAEAWGNRGSSRWSSSVPPLGVDTHLALLTLDPPPLPPGHPRAATQFHATITPATPGPVSRN